MSLAADPGTLDVELRIDRVDNVVLEGLTAYGDEVRFDGSHVRLRVRTEDTVPQIARWLVGLGVGIHALGGRRKSLEEWFIEVMGEDQRPG
jgi:hypothetical protein